jgi:hypothetical protein
LKFHSICSSFVLFFFSFGFIFIQMDQIAGNVLTVLIEKNMIFTIFFIFINLPLYYAFQAPLSLWDFFQLSSTCPFHLKIGTCSLNIMLNNNFNSHTQRDSQNPYNSRLNQKLALWASSKKKKTTTFNKIIS